MKILLVDDDNLVLLYLEGLLKQYGEIDKANTTNEAVEMFIEAYENDDPYSIIFLDVVMPNHEGTVALQHIREFEQINKLPKTPIVILTAHNNPEYGILASMYGIEGYLIKDAKVDEDIKKIMDTL